jgi:hypothetical protein
MQGESREDTTPCGAPITSLHTGVNTSSNLHKLERRCLEFGFSYSIGNPISALCCKLQIRLVAHSLLHAKAGMTNCLEFTRSWRLRRFLNPTDSPGPSGQEYEVKVAEALDYEENILITLIALGVTNKVQGAHLKPWTAQWGGVERYLGAFCPLPGENFLPPGSVYIFSLLIKEFRRHLREVRWGGGEAIPERSVLSQVGGEAMILLGALHSPS